MGRGAGGEDAAGSAGGDAGVPSGAEGFYGLQPCGAEGRV